MVKTFFSQSDENPLNEALEESESKCNQLRKSKENLEKEINQLKIDNAKTVENELLLGTEVSELRNFAEHLKITEKINTNKNLKTKEYHRKIRETSR